jgi:hypothetical protein
MKRTAVLELIATVLNQRNTGHYFYNEMEHADLVLRKLEDLDIIKPTHQRTVIRRDFELIPYEDMVVVSGWESEDE